MSALYCAIILTGIFMLDAELCIQNAKALKRSLFNSDCVEFSLSFQPLLVVQQCVSNLCHFSIPRHFGTSFADTYIFYHLQ